MWTAVACGRDGAGEGQRPARRAVEARQRDDHDRVAAPSSSPLRRGPPAAGGTWTGSGPGWQASGRSGSAISTITIQAPDRNFVLATITDDDRGRGRAHAVDHQAAAPAGLAAPPPAHHHARLGEGEGDEDADRVERDQGRDAGAEDDQQQRGQPASAMMPVVKASRRRGTANWRGMKRSRARKLDEAREVREGGVGGQRPGSARSRSGRGAGTQPSPTTWRGDLATGPSAPRSGRARRRCWLARQLMPRKSDAEDDAHPGQRRPRVAPLGRLEGRARRRRSPRRRSAPTAARAKARRIRKSVSALGRRSAASRRRAARSVRRSPMTAAEQAPADAARSSRRCTGRSGAMKIDAGLADAAQVAERSAITTIATPISDPLVEEARHDGGQRRDAGGDRDRHGQHVVDQQRAGGHQPGQRAEVVAGDDVAAGAVRVGA